MGQYSKKGIYSGYDKNHKEREALDYYATPTKEVVNILNIIKPNFNENTTILEPACGGGHMVEGIYKYSPTARIIATDIKQRSNPFLSRDAVGNNVMYHYGEKYDYLSPSYEENLGIVTTDYVVMNPPFSLLTPFVLHSFEIATKGVIMLARLKFLETQGRYNDIFKEYPPTSIYGYIDRIACYKNGNFSVKPHLIEAYAWFYWDVTKPLKKTSEYNWIWSSGKAE